MTDKEFNEEQKWLKRVMDIEVKAKYNCLRCAREGRQVVAVKWERIRIKAMEMIEKQLDPMVESK